MWATTAMHTAATLKMVVLYLLLTKIFFFFNVGKLMDGVLMPDHFNGLYQSCQCKNTAYNPIQILLAVGNTLHQPFSAKNKNTVSCQCAQANSNDVNIVLAFYRLQYFF
jgi:hypothetical protein